MTKNKKSYSIIFIGAGRVAGHLSRALHDAGHRIIQVISRTEESARTLANVFGCAWDTDIAKMLPDPDLIIFAVRDDALQALIARMDVGEASVVHTGGSIPMSVFEGKARSYGVFYPLQTFSAGRTPDIRKIPMCIEANTSGNELMLMDLARQISDVVLRVDSTKRLTLHLAAIMINNFGNHLLVLAQEILRKEQLSLDLLRPLLEETVAKAFDLGPRKAQTGPAARNDKMVIKKHLDLLSCSPEIQRVYQVFTASIQHHMEKGK